MTNKVGELTGVGNRGKGRPKGSVNKATRTFRDTINRLLDDNAENVSLWLSQVAQDDPAKALDLMSKLAEYAAPKLSRTEHTGEEGGPVQMQIGWLE
jgi:hypothetical protein